MNTYSFKRKLISLRASHECQFCSRYMPMHGIYTPPPNGFNDYFCKNCYYWHRDVNSGAWFVILLDLKSNFLFLQSGVSKKIQLFEWSGKDISRYFDGISSVFNSSNLDSVAYIKYKKLSPATIEKILMLRNFQ